MLIDVYANLSDTFFNVKLKMPVGISNAKITVFDTNNRLVHTGEFKFDEVYTFGEKLEAGVYIVRVTQEGKLGSVRLVKY